MKARVWGTTLVLATVCAVSSGCGLALRGAAVGYRSSSSATTSATTTSSAPANLVANDSFETGISPWQPMQPYSRITTTRKPHLFGNQALIARPTSGGVPYFGAQVAVVHHPMLGTFYEASAWVRSRTVGEVHVALFIVKRTPNGWTSVILGSRSRPGTHGWQRLSVRSSVTARHAYVLEFEIAANGEKRSSQLVVDGVEAKFVPTPGTQKKRPATHKKQG